MYLKPGTRLLCACKYSRLLVNGVFYEVVVVCKKFVTVRMCEAYRRDRTRPKTGDEKTRLREEKTRLREEKRTDALEGGIVLSHRDASLALRLSYCPCYASTQGRTIDKRMLLFDLEHPHFGVRSLIVGLSRVTDGSLVHVATVEQEKSLMARTRPVPLPPKEVECPDSSDSEDE